VRWILLLATAVCWAQDAQQVQPTLDQRIEETQQQYYHYTQLAQQYRRKAMELSTSNPSTLNISQQEYERQQQEAETLAGQYAQKAAQLYNQLQELYREKRSEPALN
jgi:Rps23 Pro-64 3,4-dihydroxylase Tpa1-like proline 4-hydroxylase